MLLVLACRPEEPGAERSLARLATDPGARRLAPRALSRGRRRAARRRARAPAEAAFAAACHEVSGGNPFLLGELARALAAEAIAPAAEQARACASWRPSGRAHRRGCASRGSRPTRGRSRRPSRCWATRRRPARGRLAGLDDAEARGRRRAARRRDPRPGRALRFVHPLVRTALDAELPAGERAAAHARAATCCARAARRRSGWPRTWPRPSPAATARRSRPCWRRPARRWAAARRARRART